MQNLSSNKEEEYVEIAIIIREVYTLLSEFKRLL